MSKSTNTTLFSTTLALHFFLFLVHAPSIFTNFDTFREKFLKKKVKKLLEQVQGWWCGIICVTFSIWRVEFGMYFFADLFLHGTRWWETGSTSSICFYVACMKIWLWIQGNSIWQAVNELHLFCTYICSRCWDWITKL